MTHVYWFVVWWVRDDRKELKSLFLRIWRFTFNSIMSPHSSHSKNIMISLINKDLKQKSKLKIPAGTFIKDYVSLWSFIFRLSVTI